MAYISDFATSQAASDALSLIVALPPHVTGDLLIVTAGKDDATGGSFSMTGGWTLGRETALGASGTNTIRAAWWWKWADSSAEPNPVVTSADADTWCAAALVIKGAHYNVSSEADFISVENSNTDSANPYLATGIATAHDNTLYLIMTHADTNVAAGAVAMGAAVPGYVNLLNEQNGFGADAGNTIGIAWTIVPTASTPADAEWHLQSAGDDTIFLKLAIRDSGEGFIPGYPKLGYGLLLHPLNGIGLWKTGDSTSATNADCPLLGSDPAPADPTACWQEDNSTATFTSQLTAATNGTDNDVTPFPAAEAVNDAFYIGYSSPFTGISIDTAGATRAVPNNTNVIAWEYFNGSTWQPLSAFKLFDETTGFSNALQDRRAVGFTEPADWATTTISGTNAYYVRARLTGTFATTNPTLSQIRVGQHAVAYRINANVANTGVNPFQSGITSAAVVNGALFHGSYYSFGSTFDVTPGIVVGTYVFQTGRSYFNLGERFEGGGAHLILADASDNHKAWPIGYFNDGNETIPDGRNVYVVDTNQATDTSDFGSATPPTLTAVKKMFIGAADNNGTTQMYFNQLQRIDSFNINGGTASFPVTYAQLVTVANGAVVPLIKDNTCYVPLTFGGDQDLYLDLSLFSLNFPPLAVNGATKVHLDDNVLGIIIDADAADTIKIRNGTLVTTSPNYFQFTVENSSTSAAYDFTGLTLIRATVTLKDLGSFVFTSMSFIDCASVEQNSAVMTQCSFSNSVVISDDPELITESSHTLGSDQDTGHAYELTATGTYELTNLTFTGYGPARFGFHTTNDVNAGTDVVTEVDHGYVDGDAVYYQKMGGSVNMGLSDATLYYVNAVDDDTLAFYATKADALADASRIALTSTGSETHFINSARAAIYNNTGGAVTLNVRGGTNPSIRNGTGESTTVNLVADLTLTGLVSNSEVRAYTGTDPATAVEIGGVENSGTSFNFTHSAGGVVGYIVIHKADYESITLDITYSGSDQTIPVQQQADRNYFNPA